MRSIGKKALCVALCALLTGGAAVTAAAVSKKDCPAPAVSPLEALFDGIACFSARIFERLRRTDETRLPAPAPLPPTGEPTAETPASEPTEAEIAAETWRCTELTFYSEKTYADPFADVSLDALPFTVGDDASRKINTGNNALIYVDDLLVFGKALNAGDMKKLAEYYGI